VPPDLGAFGQVSHETVQRRLILEEIVDRKLNRTYVEPVLCYTVLGYTASPKYSLSCFPDPNTALAISFSFSVEIANASPLRILELLVPVTNNARGSFVLFLHIQISRTRTVKIIVDVVAGHVNAEHKINTRRNPF
jgi:hypothetical protein